MRSLGPLTILLLLIGCASTPPPSGLLEEAEAMLENSVAAGADEYAPIELRFAREKLAGARLAIEDRDFESASWLLNQSIVNSELAMAKSDAARARDAVRRQQAANDKLRADLEPEDS